MEWGYVLGLGTITLTVIALFVYFGRKLSRAAEKHADDIDLPLYITPSGTTLFASLVAFWIVCVAAPILRPESSLGVFLSRADGMVVAVAGSVFFAGIAAAILNQLGYPVAKRDNH